MRYFIKFAYNGKNYHGFQVQPNAITVQEVLCNALSVLLKETISITAAGRTDTGVHAKEMFAHFDCEQKMDTYYIKQKLNSFLPKDIAIFSIFEVKNDAHARFDAISRTYNYHIHTKKDVFLQEGSWFFSHTLDVEKMNLACEILLQHTDFECFSKVHTDVNTFNCKLSVAFWIQEENRLIFTITADRFLRNMVRAIVGTLVNVGLGKTSLEELIEIIESKNRNKAGFSAPAHGLYLTKVTYPFLESS